MKGLANISPAADFELDKTDELYVDIGEACEDLEETIFLYNKNYSYKTEESVMRNHMSFHDYLEERKKFLDKEDETSKAQRLAEYKSVDMYLKEMIEAREASKRLFSNKQGIGEMRPFKTTRVDRSKSQAVQLVATKGKHLVHLDADTLVARHLPSKLLHRVSKLQRKLHQKEEEEIMRQRQIEAEARMYEEQQRLEQERERAEDEEGEEDWEDDHQQGSQSD